MNGCRLLLVAVDVWAVVIAAAAALSAPVESHGSTAGVVGREAVAADTFAAQVDLAPLGRLAVQHQGRIKSFDSHASSLMHAVTGPRRYNDQSPGFTYLDLLLRPELYRDADLIYVKNRPMRGQIAESLRASWDEGIEQLQRAGDAAVRERLAGRSGELRAGLEERLDRFLKTGLISSAMLADSRVTELLARLRGDLIRTEKFVQQIETALAVADPRLLGDSLRIVPALPPRGDASSRWLTIDELAALPPTSEALGSLDPALRDQIVGTWQAMQTAWREADAARVSESAAQLAAFLPRVNTLPGVYPSPDRLGWESWYFKARNLTWVWMLYLLAAIPLLASVIYRWNGARWAGLALFALAFGFHTFALGLRWYVSGRWPNSNMFEAVTTAAWFGGCLALVLEAITGRSPMRNIPALASTTASMVALMCAHFLPVYLNPNISNMMPVLHDVWLYIHTNVIIFSYCLIFMAAMSSVLYLGWRAVRGGRATGGSSGVASGAGAAAGSGRDDYARVGGAGSLIVTTPTGEPYLLQARTTPGQVFDGMTMVLMELSFIMLWAGLVMGAIWADHSWGRPWGWDPKEVFALNTFIVFAVLVHVRLKTKDKGLWTALLALSGAAVMLFNWIVINFVITGLHSYA